MGGLRSLRIACAVIAFSVCVVPTRAGAAELPVLTKNVDLVGSIPDAGAISASFDPNRPNMYVSTLHGIDVYDISDPELPVLAGAVPIAMFQNENVNLGTAAHRPDGTSFVLIGTDLGGAAPATRPTSIAVEPGRGGYVQHVYVVDVTEPTAPFIRSHLGVSTYTHTISCISASCRYAYTAGTNAEFSIIDLGDLDHPKEIKRINNHKWGWHDWQIDPAGVAWKAGEQGTVAYDITDPLRPKMLNTTNKQALTGAAWNDFIHHNTERPYAKRMPIGSVAEPGTPSVFRGDVLMVTEEDLNPGVCTDEASFQTWRIPSLRAGDNPTSKPGKGTIVPLDSWQTELYETEAPTVGGQCSAHYFDFHQSGFVAQAWYEHGIRILDVRNARDIKQVGYFVTEAQEAWSAYWVPKRDAKGRVVTGPQGTPLRTTLVYTTDAVRGIDILRVTLPNANGTGTRAVRAPILDSWLASDTPAKAPTGPGFSCRILR